MAVSEYLSTKSEGGPEVSLKAVLYTRITYVITVTLLVFPYFLLGSSYAPLGLPWGDTLIMITGFTFFMAACRTLPTAARSLRWWR